METQGEKKSRVGYQLPASLIRRVKIEAAISDVSASTLVERYIEEGLEEDLAARARDGKGDC